jgi:hypothetical protein
MADIYPSGALELRRLIQDWHRMLDTHPEVMAAILNTPEGQQCWAILSQRMDECLGRWKPATAEAREAEDAVFKQLMDSLVERYAK